LSVAGAIYEPWGLSPGGVAERLNAAVSKTVVNAESHLWRLAANFGFGWQFLPSLQGIYRWVMLHGRRGVGAGDRLKPPERQYDGRATGAQPAN
jgi:hypothetical protein